MNKLTGFLKRHFPVFVFNRYWRKRNPHNETYAVNFFPAERVTVGRATYGPVNVSSFGGDGEGLSIGSYCSIGGNVRFLLGGGHNYHRLSTYPFQEKIYHTGRDSISGGRVVVEDDVWIGNDVLILSGVHLGQGCVIGAGTVVAKDIPPYAVYAGGRILRYRFSAEIIEKLAGKDFSMLDLEAYRKFSTVELTDENVDGILRLCFPGQR